MTTNTTESIVSLIDLRAASAEAAMGPAGADLVYAAAVAELLDPQVPAETRLARLAAGMILLRSISLPGRFEDIYTALYEIVYAWADAVDGIDQEDLEARGLLPEMGGIWLPSDNFGESPVHPCWFSEEDLEDLELLCERTLSDEEVAERRMLPLKAAEGIPVDLYGARIWTKAA